MDSTTKRILTSREDMAIVRLITFSIIITMACGINRSIFFVPSAQLTSECTIPSLEIGETYDIAAVDFEVHSKMCEVVSGARKVQLIVINILNEVRITAAKRQILGDAGLYYSQGEDNQLVQLSKLEQRSRRKKMLDKISMISGNLDHTTVVEYVVVFHGTVENHL